MSRRSRSHARQLRIRNRAAGHAHRRARRQSASSDRLLDLAEWLAADDEAFEIALRSWHAAGHRGLEPRTGLRSAEAAPPIIVELAANAPPAALAATEAAVKAVAPLAAVELVRVPPLPSDAQLRIRGAWVARDAPRSASRRQDRAMAAFAEAFEAALAAAARTGRSR